MEALRAALLFLHVLLDRISALIAAPPRWAHSAIYSGVSTYLRNAPANMPFPFSFFSGFEGSNDEDLCRDITRLSTWATSSMPGACAERIFNYFTARATVIEAILVAIVVVSAAYHFPSGLVQAVSGITKWGTAIKSKRLYNPALRKQQDADKKLKEMQLTLLKALGTHLKDTAASDGRITVRHYWNRMVHAPTKTALDADPGVLLADDPVADELVADGKAE